MPWTEEMKEKQRARINNSKPWLKSTGPTTSDGKKKSSENSLKHAKQTAQKLALKKLVNLHKYLSDALYNEINQQLDDADIKTLPKKGYQRKEIPLEQVEELITTLIAISQSN